MTWLHRLLHPHCEHCLEEKRESRHCESCDTLTRQLEIVQAEKKQLLQSILHPSQPEMREVELPQPIVPKNKPWNVRRQQYEMQDKEKFDALKLAAERAKEIKATMTKSSTDKLEEEMGVSDGTG